VNTPTHILVNLSILYRQSGQPLAPIIWGAIIPDLPIVIMYIWERFINRESSQTIWREIYFQDSFWQNFIDFPNSLPLILIGLSLAWYFRHTWFQLFFTSLGLHSLFDIPVHTADAHRHFFPFSDYRFISSYSYWNHQEYGYLVSLVELAIILGCSFYLWPKLTSRPLRLTILLINFVLIAGHFGFHIFRYL
jgi:hypothetical protein